MKALILCAGYGTRLLPYTRTLPKPLFTVNNRPVLDLTIERLIGCGCQKIYINTHHLGDQIQAFVDAHPMAARLETVYEPRILDTGGAIANLESQLNDSDFFVVNADIIWDFDLDTLMAAHRYSGALATLLVHNYPRFNKLNIVMDKINGNLGRVIDFDQGPETGMAFTGIQAVSPDIFKHMLKEPAFSSIDLYRQLCPSGRIRALIARNLFWHDMGTPEDYTTVSRQCLAAACFGLPLPQACNIKTDPVAGDGSDRQWFRAVHGHDQMVICDHDICLPRETETGQDPLSTQPDRLLQLKAFLSIGRHLHHAGLPVPGILGHDTVSGQVAVSDLGSTHLADLVNPADHTGTFELYCRVIDVLIRFSQQGIQGFDPAWTCQTPSYSKPLILDMECRYFLDAFVAGYLGRKTEWQTLAPAFSHIADQALAHGLQGLIHRDLQSRNIMVQHGKIWFIDFQSARKGPLQYDLASLLIDPYVKLPQDIQDQLVAYTMEQLDISGSQGQTHFIQSFDFCCITRNLQMLGAFGYLSRVKNKPRFERYIPHALAGLKQRLNTRQQHQILAPLAKMVDNL